MIGEKHIVETELLQKIKLLFEYRLFPDLLKLNNEEFSTENPILYRKLTQLQKAIYYLDAHLEAQLNPEPVILNAHWDNIHTHLLSLDVAVEDFGNYVNHILKYQRHELELRQNKTPLRFKMEYFYFYKSCDVKLLRRLIYEKTAIPVKMGKLSEWRYYDLITEINDDIEDVFEDIQFYNGNRFLISLILSGKKKTYTEFSEFIDYIRKRNNEKIKTGNNVLIKEFIYDNTAKRITETRLLLEKNIESISQEDLTHSKLFAKILNKQYEQS